MALIADAANISAEGKLNVLGEFDTIFAASIPATHPTLWFVAKLLVSTSDIGKRKVLLRLVDEDGNTVIPPLTGQLEIPPPGPGFEGEHRALPLVLGASNITFPRFGAYAFELRVDDKVLAEVPLYVKPLQAHR